MNDPRRATDPGFPEDLRQLFAWSGICIADLDDELRLREANANLLRHLGRRSEEIRGLSFLTLLHHDVRQDVQAELTTLVAGDRDRFSRRIMVTHQDGTLLAGRMTAMSVPGPGRRVRTLLVMIAPDQPGRPDTPLAPPVPLQPVDARLLEALAVGASTADMAEQCSMSEGGVEYRVAALLRRLDVPNRPALVAKAHATGLFAIGGWPPRIRREYIADS